MPPKFSKKRASKADEYDSDGGFVEDAPQSKRAKTTKTISRDKQIDDDGNPYWELSGKRRVTLSEFKNMSMVRTSSYHQVNIREYYEKDGKALPGKKGISLSLEQFSAFVEVLPKLEQTLKAKGQDLPRPNYGSNEHTESSPKNFKSEPAGSEDDPPETSSTSKLGKVKHEKKNHEATSDEDA